MSLQSKTILQWTLVISIAFYISNESFHWIFSKDFELMFLSIIGGVNLIALGGLFFKKQVEKSAIILMASRLPIFWIATNDIQSIVNLVLIGVLALIFWLNQDEAYIPDAQSS